MKSLTSWHRQKTSEMIVTNRSLIKTVISSLSIAFFMSFLSFFQHILRDPSVKVLEKKVLELDKKWRQYEMDIA
jgi:hypothetical protein